MIGALFRRSSIYFGGLVANKFVFFIYYILLARYFLPDSFGVILLWSMLIQITTVIADWGINQWYQREVHKRDRSEVLTQLFSFRITTLVFSIVLATIILPFTNFFSPKLTLLFIVSLIPDAIISFTDGYYLEKKQGLIVTLKQTSKILILTLIFLIKRDTFTLDNAFESYFISAAISAFWSFPYKELIMEKFAYYLKPQRLKKVLHEALPYTLLNLTSFTYARADSILIGGLVSSAALGLYGSAYRFLEGASLLPTALSHNMFSESAKSNITLSHLVKIEIVMILTGFATAFLFFFFSPFIITTVLGSAYEGAIIPMQIFSFVLFLFFINAPLNTAVLASKIVNKFTPLGIGNTVLNIGFNLIFIPTIGISGAAWAMFASEITGLIINIYFVKKVYDVM